MDAKYYTVVKIDGEYAYIREDGATVGDDIYIAMALLPLGVDIGARLKYENFEFEMI